MAISVGDTLPEASFQIMTEDGPALKTISELCDGKKVIIFGLPGAFTPTCHASHLPGFLENLDAFREKGIDDIAVTTVNDIHVTNAWAKETGGSGKIHYLADGNGDFAKSIGMDVDLSVAGMGVRSKRYAMVVDNRAVTHINIEDAPGQAVISSAAALLEEL